MIHFITSIRLWIDELSCIKMNRLEIFTVGKRIWLLVLFRFLLIVWHAKVFHAIFMTCNFHFYMHRLFVITTIFPFSRSISFLYHFSSFSICLWLVQKLVLDMTYNHIWTPKPSTLTLVLGLVTSQGNNAIKTFIILPWWLQHNVLKWWIFQKAVFLKRNFFLWKETNNLLKYSIVFKFLKWKFQINYLTNMCWSCPCTVVYITQLGKDAKRFFITSIH